MHRTSLSQFQLPAPSNFFPPEAKQALLSAIFSRPLGENADLTTEDTESAEDCLSEPCRAGVPPAVEWVMPQAGRLRYIPEAQKTIAIWRYDSSFSLVQSRSILCNPLHLCALCVLCLARSRSLALRANLRFLFLGPAPVLDCGQFKNLPQQKTTWHGACFVGIAVKPTQDRVTTHKSL